MRESSCCDGVAIRQGLARPQALANGRGSLLGADTYVTVTTSSRPAPDLVEAGRLKPNNRFLRKFDPNLYDKFN